jgi:hypothetical protein
MNWPLVQIARECEDAASGLQIFLDEVPTKATDISGCMAELFGVSSALRALDHALDFGQYGKFSGRIAGDAEIVFPSLQYTLKDVRRMFADSGRRVSAPGAFPEPPAYHVLWEDLSRDMKDDGLGLCSRLELYRVFTQGMFDILRGDHPDDRDMDQIRPRVRRLLRKQEPLDARLERLDLDPRPRTPAASHRPSVHAYYSYPSYPPAAPEVPLSPTSSSSSGQTRTSRDTYFGSNNSSSTKPTHWAMYIFDGQHPVSPLHYHGEPTKCLGRDEPLAVKMLGDDGFIKVLEMPFEATDVWVRLYWRPTDHRSRILFLTQEKGIRYRFCIPLTALKVIRTESTLQLCRVNRADGELDLWANLKFTCYERMVLFYCTVVAMKRQDWIPAPQGLQDFFQPGEKEEFGGEIEDDRFLHAFRIFKDKDSGCVRFEATARRGPMTKCPIWTAFVTSYIGSKTWMRRVSDRTVQLRELKPYVFCDNYRPNKGPTGKFELKFTSRSGNAKPRSVSLVSLHAPADFFALDADDFMDTFHKIRTK